jgi:hypothetical protein
MKHFFKEHFFPYFIGAIVAVAFCLLLMTLAPLQAGEQIPGQANDLSAPLWALGAGLAADYALGKSKAVKPNSVVDLIILGLQAVIAALRSRRR